MNFLRGIYGCIKWGIKYLKEYIFKSKCTKRGINMKKCVLHGDDLKNLRIAKNVYIADAFLDLNDIITIESGVGFGHQVKILTGSHDYTKTGKERAKVISKPVTIRTGAWVASCSIILPGTEIGEYAVVGAGSVVRGKVPPYTLVAGNPAKTIRNIERAVNAINV